MPPKNSKKTSKWITHVKNYSKTHNCSYGEAMTRAKPSYGRGQAGGAWYNDSHKFLKTILESVKLLTGLLIKATLADMLELSARLLLLLEFLVMGLRGCFL